MRPIATACTREPIRKALWEELTGKETAEHVAGIVRRLVDEELL